MNHDEEALTTILTHSQCLIGAADSGAHTKFLTLGRYPTHFLAHWRRVQKTDGYHYLIVNGDVTFDHGECTGVLPGRMLRSYDIVAN